MYLSMHMLRIWDIGSLNAQKVPASDSSDAGTNNPWYHPDSAILIQAATLIRSLTFSNVPNYAAYAFIWKAPVWRWCIALSDRAFSRWPHLSVDEWDFNSLSIHLLHHLSILYLHFLTSENVFSLPTLMAYYDLTLTQSQVGILIR